MEQNSVIVFHQIIVMFLLMAVGYLAFRRGLIDNHTTRQISVLLNTVVIPGNILNSFNRSFEAGLARTLLWTAVAAVLLFVLSIGLITVLYRPGRTRASVPDCRLCALLSNNGFMAIPLVSAMFGPTGVFLASAHIVVMTITLWTYGVSQLDRTHPISLRRALCNPGVIAAVLGLALFLSPVQLPGDLSQAIGFVADLNTPLAMIVLGGYLAQVNLKACFTDRLLWQISAVRLLVIPALTIALLLFFPIDNAAKLTLLVGSAAPSAVAAAMFAQMYDTDYLFSTRVVALTTILSLVTLPAVIAVMSALLA